MNWHDPLTIANTVMVVSGIALAVIIYLLIKHRPK